MAVRLVRPTSRTPSSRPNHTSIMPDKPTPPKDGVNDEKLEDTTEADAARARKATQAKEAKQKEEKQRAHFPHFLSHFTPRRPLLPRAIPPLPFVPFLPPFVPHLSCLPSFLCYRTFAKAKTIHSDRK